MKRLARARLVSFALLTAALGCGSNAPPAVTATTTVALTAADRTDAARASAYIAKAARYREAAAAQRRQVAAYERWSPREGRGVTTNWNDKLKAAHEKRVAAADQVAARVQVLADFHAAEAEKETAR